MNSRRLQTVLLWLGIGLVSHPAWAARYDLNLSKYDFQDLELAKSNYVNLIHELGLITAPAFLAPAETLGLNGFEFSFEGTLAPIHNQEKYWSEATEGSPNSVLFIPRIHARKGLPFSFEVGTQLSYIPESELFVVGAEAKWAINEGFYFIPDLAVRIAINHMIGAKEFELSTGGWDVSLSKAFGIGGMLSLTPYAGYNMLFIHSSSHVILDNTLQPRTFPEINWQDNRFDRFFVGCRLMTHIFQVTVEGVFASKSVNLFSVKLGFDY